MISMTKEEIVKKCELAANNMRKSAIEIGYVANKDKHNVHYGPAFSLIDILATLYIGKMNINRNNIKNLNRDRFILSKGHGAIGLYSALYVSGIISKDEFGSFYQNGGDFPAHPVMCNDKGIEFSSGSLGMGLSLGIGTALAGKIKNLTYEVYVLMGNGECNEGIVWEGAMFAKFNKLKRLTVIVDNNEMQSDGRSKNILNYDVEGVWKGFGWDVITVKDGNDIYQLYEALCQTRESSLPRVIIANTVKGKGVSFMENNKDWHHSSLKEEQYEIALNELTKKEK
jgi:transketolase